jgi:hypothetical protein
MDMVDLEFEIPLDEVDPLTSKFLNVFPQLPSISTFKKKSNKGYILYLSPDQYTRYMNLPSDAVIYKDICKKDIDYISVYSEDDIEDLPFD